MDNKLILTLAKNKNELFTIRKISQKLKLPYSSTYRKIKLLQDRNYLNLEKIGSSETIKLNIKESLLLKLSHAADEERITFLKKFGLINKLYQDLIKDYEGIVLIFGSYAKNEQRKSSDIDIMILNSSGKKDLDFIKFETLLNKEINPMFFSYKEFEEMLSEKEENVGKQAFKGHVLLNGHYRFWKGVFNGF